MTRRVDRDWGREHVCRRIGRERIHLPAKRGGQVWGEVVILVLGLGYVAYRLSLPVRATGAERRGDHERADSLRARGRFLSIGVTSALTLALLVFVAAAIATR